MAKKTKKPDPNAGKPLGPTGVFVACPLNGDAHAERVALEIKRTEDKNGIIRHGAHCPFCNTRMFLNNWIGKPALKIKGPPFTLTMNIVQVEAAGLHPTRINDDRKAELLAELGLRAVGPPMAQPPGPASWHQPKPIVVPVPQRSKKRR